MRIEARRTGALGMDIGVDASIPARIHLRQFHFPTWRLTRPDGTPGPPREPTGRDRLASFEVPAGRTELRLHWAPGALLVGVNVASLLAWVGLVLAFALGRTSGWRRSGGARHGGTGDGRRA